MRSIRQWWKSASLTTQLTMIISGLMLLTVLATAFLTASLYRTELVRQIDDDLHGNRNNVSMFLTSLGSSASEDRGSFQQSIVRFYGESWDNDGNVNASIQTLMGEDTPIIEPMNAKEAASSGAFNVPGTNGTEWRVHVYRLESNTGSVAIALPLEPVELAIDRVTTLVVTIGLIATFISSIIAHALASHTFKPLHRVQRTAAAIAAGDLSRRVDLGPPDTEVGRLSRSLNAMLAHIEIAFRSKEASEKRMRQFVQDASHELRTPLVTIRGFSELYRHGGIADKDDIDTAMARIESEATRMTQLVEDLLTLARLDEQRPMESHPLDLLTIASDVLVDTRVNAPKREVKLVGLDNSKPVSALTQGDENRIRQVVTNLIGNVLRYTPDDTPIEIAVGTVDTLQGLDSNTAEARDAVIEIRDHGPGISEEDAARIFERFYRADSSRQRETGGTGLGLAIVSAIVAQHDGSVRHRETEGGGATMSIHLPWCGLKTDDEELEVEDLDEALTDEESEPVDGAEKLGKSTQGPIAPPPPSMQLPHLQAPPPPLDPPQGPISNDKN